MTDNDSNSKKCVVIGKKFHISKSKEAKYKDDPVWKSLVSSREKQRDLLHEYYMRGDDMENKPMHIIRELRKKRNAYKRQDTKSECWDEYHFITEERIVELLVASKMLCHYCRSQLYLLYEKVREPKQWTLDRIDNDQGHNMENCVIACLACNLERRTMDEKRFLFSKQFVLTKKD